MQIKQIITKTIKIVAQTIKSIFEILIYNNISLANSINKSNKLPIENKLAVLGNGNSLNEICISTGYDFLVVNRHVLSETYINLRPKYYVLADPHFFYHENGLEVIKKIFEVTQWNMILFIPYKKNRLSKRIKYKNELITIVEYNQHTFTGLEKIKQILYKLNLAIPYIQNVLAASVYIGVCLKYKQIELYGVEHSWLKQLSVNDDNKVCLDNPHFFDKEKTPPKTWEEIHYRDAKLHEVLSMYAKMFEAYFDVNAFALNMNCNIYNCTPNSYIDAFQRKLN